MPSTISAGTTAGTAIAVTGDTTGNLAFQTNGTTTAMTINTSQNILVGTTNSDVGGSVAGIRMNQAGDMISCIDGSGLLHYQSPVAADRRNTAGDGVMYGMWRAGIYQCGIGATNGSAMTFFTGNNASQTERMRITSAGDLQFNSGYGSVATAYGCRAWVNFDGSTSPGTIRGSGNVSSVSRTGTGQYTVNFTTSMPDANYSVVGIANADSRTVSIGNLLAGSAAIRTTNTAGALENQTLVAIAVFR